jgi:type I restriction enzyme S subunit
MSFQSSYPLVPLGEVARFINGDRSTNYPKGDDYVEDGTPFISATELREGRIDYSGVRRITSSSFERLRSGKIQRDDVLFCLRGSIGKIAYVKDGEVGAIASSLVIVRASERINSQYLFFGMSSQAGQQAAMGLNNGAAQPNLSVGELQKIHLPLPTLPIQRRIAGILSAYDDLIENCQRRIQILEEMARSLYREWFVNFRYPGHESVPLVPSALGEIPQGWEVRKLAELVTTKYGYTESTNLEPVGPKYLRGMDINKTSFIDWSAVPYCPISVDDLQTYKLKVGDVVVIRMADPGKVGIVEQDVDAVFASYLIRVAPKDERISPYFLFYLMESSEYYGWITGASTGTTRKSASAGVITEYNFVLPPASIMRQFERRVSEIRSLLTTLLLTSTNLRQTRDLLLPRLMSGQLEVTVD